MKKNMKSVLFYAASVAALMLAASCNKENVAPTDEPAAPSVHTIEVTVPVGVETKASYAEKKTTIQEGDKLYLEVSKTGTGAYTYAGVLDCTDAAAGTFSGTLTQTSVSEYTGTDIIAECTGLTATLLPKGYNANYYKLTKDESDNVTALTIDASEAFFAGAKGDAVPQVANASYTYLGSGEKTIILTPKNAVLYFELGGDAWTNGNVHVISVSDGTTTVAGTITVSSQKAIFAVGFVPGESRAYTVKMSGTTVGTISNTTLTANKVYNVSRTITEPAQLISGEFSVSAGQTVKFAKSNLTVAGNKFSFLENSWTYNKDITSDTEKNKFGKIDGSQHFNWSGDNGVFEAITTNGNQESTLKSEITTDLGNDWRGLSKAEWEYLLGLSSDSKRDGVWHYYAQIKGADIGTDDKRYLLIFPDSFEDTDWNETTMGTQPTNFDSTADNTIAYTEANFTAMQNAGIVILPAAGCRRDSSWYYVGYYGRYWSSTSYRASSAYYLSFGSGDVYMGFSNKSNYYFSVRLVQNVE